jgi:hypothetical protein
MAIVAGLFGNWDRAAKALDQLRAAGFGDDCVTVVASPTSAGQAAREAAEELPRPRSGFVDLGAAMGGQAERDFPEEEQLSIEERVAQGDTLIRVDVGDAERLARAELILLDNGADQVIPGTLRD